MFGRILVGSKCLVGSWSVWPLVSPVGHEARVSAALHLNTRWFLPNSGSTGLGSAEGRRFGS